MECIREALHSNHQSEESHNPRHEPDPAESSSTTWGSVLDTHHWWFRGLVNQLKALKERVLAMFKKSEDNAESISCLETQVSSQGQALCSMQLQLASHESFLEQHRATQLNVPVVQQATEQRFEALEDTVDRMRGRVEVLSVASRAQQSNFSLRFQENQRQNQVFSYDGQLVWKIENVNHSIARAEIDPQAFIASPVFYTSRSGYKICARIYLNGHGNERGTHLSLFSVILKGEFDAILQWPFSHLVEFRLICQDNIRHTIHDQFRPDPQSPAFAKPIQECNAMCGFPRFCHLAELGRNGCISDDVMFIKVTVHEK